MNPFTNHLAMVVTPVALLRLQDLEDWETRYEAAGNPACNLYLIVHRQIAYVEDGTFLIEEGVPTGTVVVPTPDGLLKAEASFTVEFDDPDALPDDFQGVISCPYPFREIVLAFDGVEIHRHMVSAHAVSEMPELAYLKVLYVGQTFEEEEYKPVRTRLEAHSTMQWILADTVRHFPHMEVFLIPCLANPNQIMAISGHKAKGPVHKSFIEEALNILDDTNLTHQRVTLAEAALIRYFMPKYNITYKKSFPKSTHTSYKEVFEKSYASVSAEIEPVLQGFKLYSETVDPVDYHYAHYWLNKNISAIDISDPSTWFSTEEA